MAGKRESNGKTAEPRDYLVGAGKGKYSVVDINGKPYALFLFLIGSPLKLPSILLSAFPWIRLASWAGVPGLERFTHIKAWLDRIEARDAVKAGLDIPVKNSFNPNATQDELDAKAKEASQWIMKGQEEKK